LHSAPPATQQADAPFAVPDNIEEKVGQKQPASSLPNQDIIQPKPIIQPNQTAPNSPNAALNPSPSLPPANTPQRGQGTKGGRGRLLLYAFLFLLLVAASVALTEIGIISLGLEKIYGKVGVERIWGGLSNNAENAVILSAVKMSQNPEYKARGSLSFTIDNSANSSLIDSLILSRNGADQSLSQSSANQAIRIEKTVNVEDTYISSNSNANTNSNQNSNSSLNSNLNSNANLNSNSNSNGNENTNADTESDYESTIKLVKTDLTYKSSANGAEANIEYPGNESNKKINMIAKEGSLYLKGDGLNLGGIIDTEKWTKYDLEQLKNETINSKFFGFEAGKGFSIQGERTGNEKIGSVRCYKYHIDNLEIGNALVNLAVKSDMVQTIKGDVWIGIRDKMIRKMNLTIISSISSPILKIETDLELYDFGNANSIANIDSFQEPAAEVTEQSLTGDAKRKQDVRSILTALEVYKSDNQAYPKSDQILKLNEKGNIIESALVPKYMLALPTDPKEGWYYGYKSDGSRCSVSARLENANDPDGQLINGIPLYIKYDQNQ